MPEKEPMLYLPLSPIVIIIVSKITLPPQNSFAQASRTKGKRAKRKGPIPENAMQ
jgi:hypothetical protein